tara:strand:+ start:167 stop:637 length:471 start_codon:yes stop_codon:yes gene_type:complete
MADQSYAESQPIVQLTTTATEGTNLVPVIDISTTGYVASVIAGPNRYTVTGVCATSASTITGNGYIEIFLGTSPTAGASNSLGKLDLTPTSSVGNVFRCETNIDLLPGQVLLMQIYGTGTGDITIGVEGYGSQFGPTEGEVDKPGSTSKVFNVDLS